MVPSRIFQIGFNRCGTNALYRFFSGNQIASVHWDHGLLAQRIEANIVARRSPLLGYDQVYAFFDMEGFGRGRIVEAFKYFPAFYQSYPDAIFILNTRLRDRWIESRLAHAGGSYAKIHMEVKRLSSTEALIRYWQDDWDRHHNEVRSFFAHRGRLVEFNIEQDNAQTLISAIPELNLDPSHFKHFRGVARSLRLVDDRL